MTTVCRCRAVAMPRTRTMRISALRPASAVMNRRRLRGPSTATYGSATVRDRNLSAPRCNRYLLTTALAISLSLIDVRAAAPGRMRASAAHLQVDGTTFRSDSRPFEWRGVSAFRLVEMVAHGHEREAAAFLDW